MVKDFMISHVMMFWERSYDNLWKEWFSDFLCHFVGLEVLKKNVRSLSTRNILRTFRAWPSRQILWFFGRCTSDLIKKLSISSRGRISDVLRGDPKTVHTYTYFLENPQISYDRIIPNNRIASQDLIYMEELLMVSYNGFSRITSQDLI